MLRTVAKNQIRATGNHDGAGERTARTTIEERFANAAPSLNPSRRKLLTEILENSEDTYFLSSRELAKRYDVDAATIVRTIQVLGYERYAEFLADLRAHFVLRISPYTVMKAAARQKRTISDYVEHSLEMEAHNLDKLRSGLTARQVVTAARSISRARHILVVGIDLAAALSHLLSYSLGSLGFDSEAPTGSAGNLHQKVRRLGPKDLLIAISFGRCLKETVEAVTRAHKGGVPTFGITDSDKSPIARFCDSYWIASIANPSFNASYVAPVAAINALLVACAHLQQDRSLAWMREKEKELKSGNRWYTPAGPDEYTT
ncbi:MAG TPA: MurR/RpiR family transcriptional regulator [Terriglobales bacterium]